jgi:hypothetical protein
LIELACCEPVVRARRGVQQSVRKSPVDEFDSDAGEVTVDLDSGGWTVLGDKKRAGQGGRDQ